MELNFDASFLVGVMLVTIRFSAVLLLTPLFAFAQIPVQFRTLFLVALATLMLLGLGVEPVNEISTTPALMKAALAEFVIGALLAFGVFSAFAAFLFGGRMLDFQMGFGVANLIDPATNTQGPLIGTVLNMMGVIVFFLLDGHHMLIRGLAYSLERLPPGVLLQDMNVTALIAQFGVMFVYGLAIVAPAVLVLLLLDVGMAVAARTMPQVNMFIVGIPLKIFVGLVVLAVSLNYMAPLLEKIYASIFHYWQDVLG